MRIMIGVKVTILLVAIIMFILDRGGEPGFVMIKEIDIPNEFEVIFIR